jgi:hypothetical protein
MIAAPMHSPRTTYSDLQKYTHIQCAAILRCSIVNCCQLLCEGDQDTMHAFCARQYTVSKGYPPKGHPPKGHPPKGYPIVHAGSCIEEAAATCNPATSTDCTKCVESHYRKITSGVVPGSKCTMVNLLEFCGFKPIAEGAEGVMEMSDSCHDEIRKSTCDARREKDRSMSACLSCVDSHMHKINRHLVKGSTCTILVTYYCCTCTPLVTYYCCTCTPLVTYDCCTCTPLVTYC